MPDATVPDAARPDATVPDATVPDAALQAGRAGQPPAATSASACAAASAPVGCASAAGAADVAPPSSGPRSAGVSVAEVAAGDALAAWSLATAEAENRARRAAAQVAEQQSEEARSRAAWPDGWVPPDYEPDDFADPWDPDDGPDDYDAWLAGLPADVREEFLAGPYTGDGEAVPPGFTHRDRGGRTGIGFAAGGPLDALEPGEWLAGALSAVTADGDRLLGESELIGVLCAWRRIASWAAAGEAAAVRELARRRDDQAVALGSKHAAEHVSDEVAAALALTGRAAGRLLEVSVRLGQLPAVTDALSRGVIDWPKAALFAGELAGLDDQIAREIAGGCWPGRGRRRRGSCGRRWAGRCWPPARTPRGTGRRRPARTPACRRGLSRRGTGAWPGGNCRPRTRSPPISG